ncbi:MAG: RNA repair transcriptional activator RtcR [Victivallaceae bacterium]|nr:RNA repair transcriptional activator RtcR [Victivallaceae bacterium]
MNILVSLLGCKLDAHGRGVGRWGIWRPSVALAMHKDIHFDRYHLIYQPEFERLMKEVTEDIKTASPNTEVIPEEVPFRDPWDFEEVYSRLYDFCIRKDFSTDGDRKYYIHITTGSHVAQICLFLLNESHHLPGVLVQTQPDRTGGAKGTYSLIDLDLSRYDLLAKRFEAKSINDQEFLKSGIATRNEKFNHLIGTIERVAVRSKEPILLTGPTGAGKSKLARRIYELKKLNNQISGDFVNVNCATLRGDQAISALFGHKKGSFTDAVSNRTGLVKTAEGGILFLDEIGELGLDEQAMLLRAIEDKKFLPLGADREESSDFQLICGTNRDLSAAVMQGRFRPDLLARINLWSFQLPGLAERREDIEPNLDYELNFFAQKNGKRITFNSEARKAFLDFAMSPRATWDANFRDLNGMIVRMATLAPGGRIDLATVNEELARTDSRKENPADDDLAGLLGPDYAERYDYFDLVQLQEVIRVCRASRNLADAGKKLFAVSRKAKKSTNDSDRLAKYLAHFGLNFNCVSRS